MAEGFGHSLFGFRREDVLSYVEKLSANYARELSEKDEEIAALREENKELRRAIKDLKKQIEE
ncbi:MAG: hypothetical protein IJB48_03540 [Clostridia bacterium]|nr:hypothetical protein [Clostridia bacterium]MBQ3553977.1 hypothetical protein [Clostridia bacterium]